MPSGREVLKLGLGLMDMRAMSPRVHGIVTLVDVCSGVAWIIPSHGVSVIYRRVVLAAHCMKSPLIWAGFGSLGLADGQRSMLVDSLV